MTQQLCPKCNKPLGEITTTASGRKLQRCSAGSWNPDTKKTDGCDYVLWLPFEPQALDEKCPKCGSPLVLAMTRFGKKMKKCSMGGWDNGSMERPNLSKKNALIVHLNSFFIQPRQGKR